ncbi:uncharacterized protein LOC113521295 [Galleria mellonella]|uniref:Uncharacterized protein LOC113521295 n=1 Tax=Galleria mellonella TaxID=7137 RepID=A0A6J1X7C7_GALME|nr:uncharacterized protein LOC113521295 [Galleria mellonella]
MAEINCEHVNDEENMNSSDSECTSTEENMGRGVQDEDNMNSSDSEDTLTEENLVRCVQLQLPKHIAAYCEKKELIRVTQPMVCDTDLMEKVCNNYIIVKKILSNLEWQEKLLCKHVCSTWNSAIHTLNKEQLNATDFVLDLHFNSIKNGIRFKKSSDFSTEPLVVFAFVNTSGTNITSKCMSLLPHPCEPPCEKEHSLLDFVQQKVCGPKNCMFTVRADYLCYFPLNHSPTYKHTYTFDMFRRPRSIIGGISIPAIPDVKFNIINIKSNSDMEKDFYYEVRELSRERIFKGVLVYVTEKYLLHSVEDFFYLNYFKEAQPDIPYALGGCIVEDCIYDKNDIKLIIDGVNEGSDFISENLISIGIFSIPKSVVNSEGEKCNFDVYSLIIEAADWQKTKIQKNIDEFSKKIPRFEHSVALKLSCVGRDKKHELEQNYFRAAFPNTPLIGCYGNGELGINHPPRPVREEPPSRKRFRRDAGPQLGIIYSYSTVFMYFGWGKIISS